MGRAPLPGRRHPQIPPFLSSRVIQKAIKGEFHAWAGPSRACTGRYFNLNRPFLEIAGARPSATWSPPATIT